MLRWTNCVYDVVVAKISRHLLYGDFKENDVRVVASTYRIKHFKIGG